MSEAITPEIVFAVLAAAGIIYGWIQSGYSDNTEVLERLTRLETKLDGLASQVEKHNSVMERTFVLERDVKTAFDRIGEAFDDIDGIKETQYKTGGTD